MTTARNHNPPTPSYQEDVAREAWAVGEAAFAGEFGVVGESPVAGESAIVR
jgi:hypothetical protein